MALKLESENEQLLQQVFTNNSKTSDKEIDEAIQ